MSLNDLERRVCKAIAQKDAALRADLARHVAIPTGRNYTPGLDAYRQLILDRLQALGATITAIAGKPRPDWLDLPGASRSESAIPVTIVAKHRAQHSTLCILLAGHLDTVHDPAGRFRELTAAADGRTALGPGAADMKGGVLIGIVALETLKECGVECDWTFLLNSDEETGSFHSMEALRSAARDHDVGIALEPAMPDGSLVTQRMGSGQFKVEVIGRAAHVGRDFARGVSAVTKLAEVIVKLGSISKPEQGLIVNVGPLVGGQVTNAVPDYAACWGNLRFADPAAAEFLLQQLEALATPSDAMPQVIVHHILNRPAKPTTPSVQKLADAARDVAQALGQRMTFASTGGVCDGNILQDAGLPTIDTLGVRGGNLHRNDEFIELASLVERCQLLAILLIRLAEGRVATS